LAKLLKDAGGLGDAFLQEQLTTASHPSSANEQRTLPKKNTFTRQQLSKQSKTITLPLNVDKAEIIYMK